MFNLGRVNPLGFFRVSAYLPGLSPGKLNSLLEVGSTYPGSTQVGIRLHCKNPTWVNSTRLNPGNFFVV